eukprot:TRINITY_DN17198_c0_g1_i1.p1 TRINITY_DN17198_c0_g1~~TRINITY_DN17198_c0_g1_i1.p1  ORF type:complete len:328 (+),score=10.29 TRINITY_DN17198_c0_g1_i1:504-1487(+)
MLNNQDPLIKNIAWCMVKDVKEIRKINTAHNSPFLNWEITEKGKTNSSGIKNLWTRTASVVQKYGLRIIQSGSLSVTLLNPNGHKINPHYPLKKMYRVLKANTGRREATTWSINKVQGKAVKFYQYKDTFNYWIRSGGGLSVAEYLFCIKTRLDLLPTKVNLVRWGTRKTTKNCTTCNRRDTIPHIFHCCTNTMSLITARHNNILEKIHQALTSSWKEVRKDVTVPETNSSLRPDIQCINNTSHILADLVIAHEDHDNCSLKQAALRKYMKYGQLTEDIRTHTGKSSTILPIVLGTTGTVPKLTLNSLKALGLKMQTARKLTNTWAR